MTTRPCIIAVVRCSLVSSLALFCSLCACSGTIGAGSDDPLSADAVASPSHADVAVDDALIEAALDVEGVDALSPEIAVPVTDAPKADDAPPSTSPCGEFTTLHFACSKDGNSRGKCVSGAGTSESCARGCQRVTGGDDVCMGTDSTWSCTGAYSKTKAPDGDYYVTAFGCWKDAAGAIHTDAADNCIPTCLDKARTTGLCDPADDGPTCEERVTWYTADGGRFGCLAHLRITNPKTGKSVIAVALDYGPSCTVETRVSKAVLDASGRIDRYLFGADQGTSDKALVHVVEVDGATPLGPE